MLDSHSKVREGNAVKKIKQATNIRSIYVVRLKKCKSTLYYGKEGMVCLKNQHFLSQISR